MKKNKGFTLIELLAIIVILAVIAVISVPLITGVIEKVQASAYKESLRGIFGATDLYVASANFNGFPNDGINITDSNIQMKNKSFTSGKIIKNAEGKLELDKVSNGSYCGSGPIDNLVIIEGSCDSLDETAPTDVTLTSNLITSNSVTIVASATDLESGISGYQFSKDNGVTWTNKQTSNIYTFTGLINNTSYTFKVKVYNNNLLSTISSEVTETTTNVEVPTYTINPTGWTKSAVVTITYPERESRYIYEYSLDEGLSWEEVASPDITKDITFTDNGSVIAKISDGVNEIIGTTYQVTNIDNVAPIITVSPETVTIGLGSTYTDSGVTASDNIDGDLTSAIITTGTVNTSVAGTYTLIYNVSDSIGNEATEVIRTVKVAAPVIVTFTSSQTWTVPSDVASVEVLVVGGGGGGGAGWGGGGGAGGLIYNNNYAVSPNTNITVTVGSGGEPAMSGENSSFGSLTALGGGAGGLDQGSTGGSGGGSGCSSSTPYTGAAGTSGQGNSGGNGAYDSWGGYEQSGGGGGGAGGAGQNATPQRSGNGGIGKQYFGTYYAGGGGGGGRVDKNTIPGTGGLGGGGNGATAATGGIGQNGMPNTGGGGGGGSRISGDTYPSGGSGGSGIVIIKFVSAE